MFMRYIAKQFSSQANTNNHGITSDNYIPTGIVINNNQLTASSSFTGSRIVLSDYDSDINRVNASTLTQKVAILGGNLNDSINSGSNADKLYGGAGNDTLVGNGGNDTLFGNAGNDQLRGGAGNDILFGETGNDTLTGGNGADIFVYENGRDVITDYAEGVDKIQLEERSIVSSTLNGSDVVIRTDNDGTLTVKDAKDKFIAIIDRDGNETSAIYGRAPLTADNVGDFDGVTLKGSKIILDDPFTGTVDLNNFSSKVKNIDATKTENVIELIGNEKNNKMTAGSGGSTLDGGAGNDKLYGGAGVDVFVYDGQGKDKVYNYAENDRIVFTDEITKAKASGKKVVFTIGKKNLTVDKAVGMTMEITTADGETNTYVFDKKTKSMDDARDNAAAQLSDDEYWFMSEDIVGDDQMDSILNVSADDNALGLSLDDPLELMKHSARSDKVIGLSTNTRHSLNK